MFTFFWLWNFQKWFPLPWERKWWGFFLMNFWENTYASDKLLVAGLLCFSTTVLWSFGVLCPGSSNSYPVCSSARALCQLPACHFINGTVIFSSMQWLLAPAYAAVFTTQGSWMFTPPISLMRPVVSSSSSRSLTHLPQQYEAKIGQVCYACYSMHWRYFLQFLKCLYYNSCS